MHACWVFWFWANFRPNGPNSPCWDFSPITKAQFGGPKKLRSRSGSPKESPNKAKRTQHKVRHLKHMDAESSGSSPTQALVFSVP